MKITVIGLVLKKHIFHAVWFAEESKTCDENGRKILLMYSMGKFLFYDL